MKQIIMNSIAANIIAVVMLILMTMSLSRIDSLGSARCNVRTPFSFLFHIGHHLLCLWIG